MHKKWHLLLCILLLLAGGCTPKGHTTSIEDTWVKLFEGPDYGAFLGMTFTPDGDVLAVGATNHLHMPPYSGDMLTMKISAEGEVLWEQTWGGEGYEQALAATPADDGGFYIFGETDSYGAGDRDFLLLKVNEKGDEQWFLTYGGALREWPYGMLRLSNGDLLIYGFTESTAGGRDENVLRLDKAGVILWQYSPEEPGEQLVLDALETEQGDLVLAVTVEEDGRLVKLDGDGSLLWQQTYILPGWQYASRVAQRDDGNFLLAGFAMNSSPRQADTWLAGASSSGELEWQKTFGEPSFDDYTTSMIRLDDGTFLLGALADGVLLTCIDAEGTILWRQSLLDPTRIYGVMDLLELEQGGYLAAGLIQLSPGRSYDAFIMRTDVEGRLGE